MSSNTTTESKAVAIIGASGGIGAAIAERISDSGAAVTLGYNSNEKAAREVADKIKAKGAKVSFSKVNIKDPSSVRDFLQTAEKEWGRLDSIVVATGPPIPIVKVVDVSYEQFKEILDTEVHGAFNTIKEGVEILRKQTGTNRSILFVLSTALLRTLKYDGMSYIPKSAVLALIKQTVKEIGGEGIRLNAVGPGAFATGMGGRIPVDISQEFKDLLEDVMTPVNRWGTGKEIAEAAEFLISDRATYISGQILGVDGGYGC